MAGEHAYIAIDLKSFYASVECIERGLDPMDANLVVADASRTEKTICLAVSPALKTFGIPGRPRLFEVVQRVKEANAARKRALGRDFSGSSCHLCELSDPALSVDYIVAAPRMSLYIKYSTDIYRIYLKYVAPEDLFAYSIDEVFIDVTAYLSTYGMTAHELCVRMLKDVQNETGITATAGIGTNLYLAKVAMDIVAKHTPADEDGVRIAELNEISYRETLWVHRPLTDFWRVGRGYAKKLEAHGLLTMGDIARCSIGTDDYYNEGLLYKLFGVNAELLIDHAWGHEPCRLSDIKAYHPENRSLGAGQVLHCPYNFEKGRLIVREMAELLALELLEKGLAADQLVLTIGYDVENLMDPERARKYRGEVTKDRYGRSVPKHAHGTLNLEKLTSSAKKIVEAAVKLYDTIVDPALSIRRVTISAGHVLPEGAVKEEKTYRQLDLFTDYAAEEEREREAERELQRERHMQQAVVTLRKRFGKNAVLKGMNLKEGGTTMLRNGQVGGHRA